MKKLSERCSAFIRGRQCDNYRGHGKNYCAVHDRGVSRQAVHGMLKQKDQQDS